jgi:hypothetical protein
VPPTEVAAAGVFTGAVSALTVEMILVLVAALWSRRPHAVAGAAILGAAIGDLLLFSAGGWLGWLVVSFLGFPSVRATVAAGVFVGLAAKVLLGQVVLGGWGVPADAALPSRPAPTAARFAAIALLMPTPALLALGVVAAWPRLWAFGAGGAFVAGAVLGSLLLRLAFATTLTRGPARRSSRTSRRAVGVTAVLVLAAMSVAALPR